MKVSVVIPSYNHKPFVEQAIRSVLEQTHDAIELIVIDDGSSDGSKALIADILAHSDKPFTFISRENRGLIKTLQEGLELAKGDYFCELASDDYFHPESIAKRVEYMESNPETAVVFTDGYAVNAAGEVLGRFTKEKVKAMYASDNPVPALLNNVTPVFATGLICTESLRLVGGFDYKVFRYYEDIDTPLRLSLVGRLGYIDEPLFYRRTHGSNVSGTTTHIRREKVYLYEKLLAVDSLQSYRPLIRKRLRRSVLALARMLKRSETVKTLDYDVLISAAKAFPYDLRLKWYILWVTYKYRRQ